MTHHDRPRCSDRASGFNVDIDLDIFAKLGADAYLPGSGNCRPRPHCPPPPQDHCPPPYRPPVVCWPPLPPSYERPYPIPRPSCQPPDWQQDRPPYIPARPVVVCPPERPPYMPARPQVPGCNDFTFGGSFGLGDSFTSWGASLEPNGWSVSGRGIGFGQMSRGAVSFGRPDS